MANPLTKEMRRDLARRAWLLRQRFHSIPQIARHLDIGVGTVHRMLAREETRLAEKFASRALQVKARQTVQLEYVATEAVTAWRRSKLDSVTVKRTDEKTTVGDSAMEATDTKVETTTKGSTGNPALLAQAREALGDIRAIWGLDAPKQAEIGGIRGGTPIGLAGLSLEKLVALESIADDMDGDGPEGGPPGDL